MRNLSVSAKSKLARGTVSCVAVLSSSQSTCGEILPIVRCSVWCWRAKRRTDSKRGEIASFETTQGHRRREAATIENR